MSLYGGRAKELYEFGMARLRDGEYQAAVVAFTDAMAVDPGTAKVALQRRAEAYRRLGKEQLAVADMSRLESLARAEAESPALRAFREQEHEEEAEGRGDLIVGGLFLVGGIVVTVVTYAGAGPGETYVVAWGAILFGGFQFIRGLTKL